jgi:glycine/D-amino acid oxidase-like deaminating enzyme/nitrite reductase/ring-hydroxylating ferredoxin subunit
MISRDGNLSSLWQSTTERYKPIEFKTLQKQYDVVIVGGGITGVTTADLLLREGLTCLLLEARELCFGTTGGTTAHINTLLDVPYTELIGNFGLDNAQAVCDACRHGIDSIRSNIKELNTECGWEECKALLFAENENQTKELNDITQACRQVGLDPHVVNGITVPIPFTSAISVATQARFHPTRYVHAMARRFEEMGGIIVENCRVTRLNEDKKQVEVVTTKGSFIAKWVVLATHIPPTINILHMRCAPYRSYAMAARIPQSQHFDDLVYDMQDPYHYYRMQTIDGERYLIAGGKDHKTGHEKNTVSCLRTLEAHIRKYFNVEAVVNTWSSQYYESADGLPYIGKLPGHSAHVLTATGFGGNGMVYSSIAARVLRNIVIGNEDGLVELFAPSRIKPIAGFKNFAAHNLDVVRTLVGRVFKSNEIDQFAAVAPGEGVVARIEDEKIAIFKDESGSLHTTNATCTHMGCAVTWNQAEKSWDCPCHGARYDVDGNVLNGPAVNDLEFINVEIVGIEKS